MSCSNYGSAQRQMARAMQHRHTRAHRLNEYSSRSHCLMTFVFASKEKEGGVQGARGGVRRWGGGAEGGSRQEKRPQAVE